MWSPQGLSFYSYRYTDNPCDCFVPSPGIFLLSDMGLERFEQSTLIVALCNYLDLGRTSEVLLFLRTA